jgi:hypothetical protein
LRVLPAHGEAPAAGASARASPFAEQIAEEIAELADIFIARGRAVARPFGAAGIFAVVALLRRFLAGRVDLAAIVAAALVRIAENVVGSPGLRSGCSFLASLR